MQHPPTAIYGFNTDVAGVIRPLENVCASRVRIVLGAAARAAVFFGSSSRERKSSSSTAPTRKPSRFPARPTLSLKQDQPAKNKFDALINTTPCGMAGISRRPHETISTPASSSTWSSLDTPLLRLAHSRGIPIISGLEMFVQQDRQARPRSRDAARSRTSPSQAPVNQRISGTPSWSRGTLWSGHHVFVFVVIGVLDDLGPLGDS